MFGHYFARPAAERACLQPWIDEMADGMQSYVARKEAASELVVLDDEDDLFRYCHYVAGTVGGLLTDLFLFHEQDVDEILATALRQRAESFAQGLQQVNIAKDLARDHRRGWQFLPRSFCEGFDPDELLNPGIRERVLAAHAKLCALAERELARALEYTLLLPPSSSARRFCAVPLLLARATFRELRGNPAVLDPSKSVKIDRSETLGLIEFIWDKVGDNEAMAAVYERLGAKSSASLSWRRG